MMNDAQGAAPIACGRGLFSNHWSGPRLSRNRLRRSGQRHRRKMAGGQLRRGRALRRRQQSGDRRGAGQADDDDGRAAAAISG